MGDSAELPKLQPWASLTSRDNLGANFEQLRRIRRHTRQLARADAEPGPALPSYLPQEEQRKCTSH